MQMLYLLWIPAVVNVGLAQTEDVNVVIVADADSSSTPAGETTEKPEESITILTTTPIPAPLTPLDTPPPTTLHPLEEYEKLPKPADKCIRYVRKDGTVMDHKIFREHRIKLENASRFCEENGMDLGSFEDENESRFVTTQYRVHECELPLECDVKLWRKVNNRKYTNKRWPLVSLDDGSLFPFSYSKASYYWDYLDTIELGVVCSKKIAELSAYPIFPDPDPKSTGVIVEKSNGAKYHYHVVSSGLITLNKARRECKKIGYKLAVFSNDREEKFVVDEYKSKYCKYCNAAYWIRHKRRNFVRYSERCYALWFKGRRRVGMDCSGRMNLRENHPYWAEGYICSKKLREHVDSSETHVEK
ncbi:hypothetical protein RB195_020619 [Necator americanus]|uniref:C-type lectin domain-containing protein n=1 Tax=Necator americanus TaxID=51031 RepID=A0ABR1CMG2_NECAM